MAADDEKILNDPQRLGKDSAVYALQDKGPVHGADEKGMVDITGPKGYNPARGAVPAKSCRRLLRIRELCHDPPGTRGVLSEKSNFLSDRGKLEKLPQAYS